MTVDKPTLSNFGASTALSFCFKKCLVSFFLTLSHHRIKKNYTIIIIILGYYLSLIIFFGLHLIIFYEVKNIILFQLLRACLSIFFVCLQYSCATNFILLSLQIYNYQILYQIQLFQNINYISNFHKQVIIQLFHFKKNYILYKKS